MKNAQAVSWRFVFQTQIFHGTCNGVSGFGGQIFTLARPRGKLASEKNENPNRKTEWQVIVLTVFI